MNAVVIEGTNYDLPSLEKDCWQKLYDGLLSYKNPFHNPVVANVNSIGVNLRTVVLREVNTAEKKLAFHTDVRSGKWKELQENNHISWLFYDAGKRVQLRLSGTVTLHAADDIANEHWNKTTMSSRKIYSGPEGPSTISAVPVSGLPPQYETADPSREESVAGRKNFAVVVTKINWMEWLWLNSHGHRRASFNYEAGALSATWLVP